MLAVHLDQRTLEAVCLTLERDDLLLGQLDVIAGALLAVLRLDVGRADDLRCFLLGLADNTVPHALGVDHRRTQGVFHRSVFFNALGQHDELFLQIIILGSQVVHCLGDLLEIIIHILTAIALERFVKCDVADILGRDHDGFPPVCGAHGPVIPCPQRCGRSCAQYW